MALQQTGLRLLHGHRGFAAAVIFIQMAGLQWVPEQSSGVTWRKRPPAAADLNPSHAPCRTTSSSAAVGWPPPPSLRPSVAGSSAKGPPAAAALVSLTRTATYGVSCGDRRQYAWEL